jgi:hypothetical protein
MGLRRNMRAIGESDNFKLWLLNVGSGMEECDYGEGFVELPKEHIVKDIISDIYGDKINILTEDMESRVVLSSKNKIVNQLNERILNLVEGKEYTYIAISTVSKTDNMEDYEKIVVDYP